MTRKGQMEIIGLVLIVFLLSIGLLFMVSVSQDKKVKSLSLNPQNAELSQNMIDAIKNIKIDCPYPTGKKIGIDDLVIDIASANKLYCYGIPSRYYTEDVITTILNSTLNDKGKSYVFTIIKNKNRPDEKSPYFIISNDANCTEKSPGKEGEQPFPISGGGGTVTISLKICN